jgi:hypothetical protein
MPVGLLCAQQLTHAIAFIYQIERSAKFGHQKVRTLCYVVSL